MKKILTFVFALALALALAVPCFASSYNFPSLPNGTKDNWIIMQDSDVDNPDQITITALNHNEGKKGTMTYLMPSGTDVYLLNNGEWVFYSTTTEAINFSPTRILYDSKGEVNNGYTVIFPVSSDSWADVLEKFQEQISVSTVVEVLVVGATAVVGLVFMWWGVRKLSSALFKAFRKGKVSI